MNAILIGRLGLTADEAIEKYLEIVSAAFTAETVSTEERIQRSRSIMEQVVINAGLKVGALMFDNDNLARNCKV